MKKIVCHFYFLLIIPFAALSGEGTFVNPLTDVCWECLFPITVSGINVTPRFSDLNNHSTAICTCAGIPPKVGIPITFWEPTKIVDVTRHAYKFLGLGGITLGHESIKNRGSVGLIGDGPSQTSFYHVHWYSFPIIALLELLTDFTCIEKSNMDILYMSEFDPLWNDDQLSLVANPEASLFANPLAQLACIADCTASSFSKPLDKLFWCAGCEGSLYPFSGTVAHHVGAIQASALLVHRVIAKMHRFGIQKGYEADEFCMAKLMPIIKKSLYKTQLVYPISQTKGPCHALGKTDLLWGASKSYPNGGEDFVYLIWTKKQCCLDAVKPAIAGGRGVL
jgi:conjugal transfer pilus assembly protein TraU